jgi:DNA repair exonuclease SbcCD ATPase subunit
MQEHPDKSISEVIKYFCPCEFYDIDDPEDCNGGVALNNLEDCKQCWNREIPETPPCGSEEVLDKLEHKTENKKENEEMNCKCEVVDMIKQLQFDKDALLEERDESKARLNSYFRMIENLKKTNEDLANKLAAERDKNIKLQNMVIDRDKENDDLMNAIAAKNEELKNLRAEKDAMSAGKAKALAEKDRIIESRIEAINKLRTEVDNLTDRVEDQKETITKYQQMRRCIEDLGCAVTADFVVIPPVAHITSVELELMDLKARYEALSSSYNSNEKALDTQNEVINSLHDKVKLRDEEIDKLVMENVDLVEAIKAKDKRIAELWGRIDKLDEERYIEQDIEATKKLYEFFIHTSPIDIQKEEPTICPINEIPYARYANHIRMKYKALTDNGFSHDDAMALIPMWDDNEFKGFKHDGFRAAVTLVDEMHEYKEN